MTLISVMSELSPSWPSIPEPKQRIHVQIDPKPCSPERIVKSLAAINGPLEIYCWYEGVQCLPQRGAHFMKESIFEPLCKLKRDAKLCLYSLKAWDFSKTLATMAPTTPLGETINRINQTAIACIYSSSFFKYCASVPKESGIYQYINQELPQKKWLFSLSENQRKKGMTVGEFFNDRITLVDCLKELDIAQAYSPLQYLEGYYLIQESLKRGLLKGEKKIQIAFVLPNDESKYYIDYPRDIEKMLHIDFGKELSEVDIVISFCFFEYGESLSARPYIDKRSLARKVGNKEIGAYFEYLSKGPSDLPTRLSQNINRWIGHC